MTAPDTSTKVDMAHMRNWWDQQALKVPESAGVLGFYDDSPEGRLYRCQAEWMRFCSIVPLQRAWQVLELGCGAGRWALNLSPKVARVVAVDYSSEMIRLAQDEKLKRKLNNIEFHCSAVEEYSSDLQFDLIYFSGVNLYLNDEQLNTALHNARTMLAPRGIIIDRCTVSLGERRLFLDRGYQALFRSIPELKALYARHGLALTCQLLSHDPMRVPYRLQQRHGFKVALAKGLTYMPELTTRLIIAASKCLDAIRPIQQGPLTHAHCFFRFERQ